MHDCNQWHQASQHRCQWQEASSLETAGKQAEEIDQLQQDLTASAEQVRTPEAPAWSDPQLWLIYARSC